MKRVLHAVVALGIAAALLGWASSAEDECDAWKRSASDEGGFARVASEPLLELPAAPRASPGAKAGVAEAQPPDTRLTSEEEGMFRVYDEIAEALEFSDGDCEAMAFAVSSALEAGETDLRQVVARQAAGSMTRTPDDPALVGAIARAQRFNAAIARVMPTCSKRLLPELKKLTSIASDVSH